MSPSKLNRKSLLPVDKILSNSQDQIRFIKILGNEADGFMSRAARQFGCSIRTVQRRMKDFPLFHEAIKVIQESHKQKRLDTLETISYDEAKQPKNFRERKFLLESLDPSRFRSTHRDISPANVQINFGFHMPEKRYGMDEIPPEAEVIDEGNPDGFEDLDVGDI